MHEHLRDSPLFSTMVSVSVVENGRYLLLNDEVHDRHARARRRVNRANSRRC
jgi:hypothetical protein